MAQKVLLISNNDFWLKNVRSSLLSSNMNILCEDTSENIGCQQKLVSSKYGAVFMDPELPAGKGFQILRYIKLNHPSLRVSFVFENKEKEQKFSFMKDLLKEAGVTDTITLNGTSQIPLIKDFGTLPAEREAEVELNAMDKDFIQVPIESFNSKNIAIFDYFVRIKENHFVKVVRKNDVIDNIRIASYQQKGVKGLHLKIEDRRHYIRKMNELLKASRPQETEAFKEKVSKCANLSDILLEEMFVQGFNEELVAECKTYCDNVSNLVKNNYRLGDINALFLDMDFKTMSHSFLVTFLSTVICKQLEWAGAKTVESVAMGALLHDIGIMLLPKELQEKDPREMSPEELIKYEDHPRLGADLLLNNPNISPQVTQIVFQHHENNTATGYPNRMSATKIYPLAKVVSLAEEVAESMVYDQVSPLDAVKMLLQDRERIMQFDPGVIKAMVASFKGKK